MLNAVVHGWNYMVFFCASMCDSTMEMCFGYLAADMHMLTESAGCEDKLT